MARAPAGRRLAVAIALATAVLGAAGAALRLGPALALSLGLAVPGSTAWLARLGAEPVREDVRVAVGAVSLDADLYRPPRAAGALVLVHGLSRDGRRHPELVRVARLLAARGLLVLVPHFPGLAAFRLGGREVEEVRASLAFLQGQSPAVGVAGFSFGAGPALVAAAGVPGLRLVASFGGYADLRRVIAYLTTGAHSFAGTRHVDAPEPYNRWKLLALLAGFVDDAGDRRRLDALAAVKLADPSAGTPGLPDGLGPEGRAVLALVRNRREDALDTLLARLAPRAREALDRLSPLAVASRLPGRVIVAHGAGDPSIPFTESQRLARAVGPDALLVILRTFHHTGPRTSLTSLGDRARDAVGLVRLADALLSLRQGER